MANDWFELTDPTHFWIKWRFQVLKKLLVPYVSPHIKILEVGCGNGLVMKQLYDELAIVIDGCDLNSFALEHRLDVPGNFYLYDIFEQSPELVEQYDIVLMLDVLEHIDDDNAFVMAAIKHLKKGGLLIVGVPAYQSLFSKYDDLIGHKRRYSGKQIKHILEIAGMDNCKYSYWGFFLLPILFIRKMALKFIATEKIVQSGFKPPNSLANQLFIWFMKLELMLFKKVATGISIMASGIKIDEKIF
jgi:SAM-dependent methyltransferase